MEIKNIDAEFLKTVVTGEIGGKMNAIHAYDRMIWTVRSGFLTLIFAGWSIILKSIVDTETKLQSFAPIILILSAFSLALALAGFKIDLNYAKRKFRVIAAVNHLMTLIVNFNSSDLQTVSKNELIDLLIISGDAHNDTYKIKPYYNETQVSKLIYFVPTLLIAGILVHLGYTNSSL